MKFHPGAKLKLSTLIFMAASCFTTSAFGIVNGRNISMAEIFQFRAYVSLTEDRTGGGGVHIGDGLILTAFHIFEDISQILTIRDVAGTEITSFAIDKEKHIRAPDFKIKFANSDEMQNLDLAILVPDPESREKIRKLPVAELKPLTNSSILKMVGIGHTDFNGTESDTGFRPKIGEFKLQNNALRNFPEFSTAHNPDRGWANGAPRDSGSPLWAISKKDKKVSVAGIAVAIFEKSDKAKDQENTTIFLSLESAAIQNWITSVQKKSHQKLASAVCHLAF